MDLAGEDGARSWTRDQLSVCHQKALRREFHWLKMRRHVRDRRTTLQMEVSSRTKGEKTVTMYSETGDQYRARYHTTDVTRPLNSVSRVCDPGNTVLFTQTVGWISNNETGRYTWFPREHGVSALHSWINESPAEKRTQWQDEPFPGPERWFQRF